VEAIPRRYASGDGLSGGAIRPESNSCLAGNGELGAAGGQNLRDTLTGRYLDPSTNPWLDKTYTAASQGLVNQYQLATAPSLMAEGITAAGGGPGSTGGSGFQEQQQFNQFGLGQNLSNLATDIYGGNYQAERAASTTGSWSGGGN